MQLQASNFTCDCGFEKVAEILREYFNVNMILDVVSVRQREHETYRIKSNDGYFYCPEGYVCRSEGTAVFHAKMPKYG